MLVGFSIKDTKSCVKVIVRKIFTFYEGDFNFQILLVFFCVILYLSGNTDLKYKW